MYANLNPGALSMHRVPFGQLVDLAVLGHFRGLDLPTDVLASPGSARAATDLVGRAGLRWGLMGLPCDFSAATAKEAAEATKALADVLPAAQLTGCSRCYNHIWPGSNELPYSANFRAHLSRFRPLVELLVDHGFRLGIEFIGTKTLRDQFRYPFISTLLEALELADALGPEVGIVLDFHHLYTSGGTVAEVAEALPVNRLVNVHANDANAARRREDQLDMEREMPLSTGVIDAAALMGWLRAGGYAGPVIIEPFSPSTDRFAAMAPADVALEAGACLSTLLAL